MTSHAQVVVIGGGIAGCSTLYHLTQEKITDCILIERDEITSGTTWHSAAQVTNFGGTQTMIGLKSKSIELYRMLAEDAEHPINYHHANGGLRLASTQDHLDGYHHFASMAKGMGVELEVIDAAECQRRHPLITTHNLLGALWDPLDGYIDPTQLCQALLRRARSAGAQVQISNPVVGLTQKRDHSWIVHCANGDIHCEKLVNACGYRCNEVGAMMDIELPVVSMEHQYLITDPIPEIEALDAMVPLIRCPTDDFYSRAERSGLLVGFYEQDCKTWGLDGIDADFSYSLCPDDLGRLVDVMEGAFKRLPCLETVGIRSVVYGPITYTPDGLPLVGKIPGKRNAYCITGLRAGLGEGGGHGWLLAQIIAHGEACYDTWCIDPRRFTRHANVEYTALKAVEDYQNEFRFHMPHEHRPAGRPVKTTSLYDTLGELGADFATVNGWERAGFYKPTSSFRETHSFKFTNSFDVVANEVRAVESSVGIMEVSGFNRYEITGHDVHGWLSHIMCSRVPKKVGKVSLCYMLNHDGNLKGEATIAKHSQDQRGREKYWYGSAAAAEMHDMDWLSEHLPSDGSIEIKNLTNDYSILVVAGPKSRHVLSKVAPRTNWSSEAFPWLTSKKVYIANAEAIAMSVSFSGELAWELHIENSALKRAFDVIWEAGQEFAIRPFGLYATESMRIEKGFRHWKSDLITEFNPYESALGKFIQPDKNFIGKDLLVKMAETGPRRMFVTIIIENNMAPAQPGSSIISNGNVIGTITSAAWGHRIGKNLALGFVAPEFARVGTKLEVEIIGVGYPAEVGAACQYDPEFRLVRA